MEARRGLPRDRAGQRHHGRGTHAEQREAAERARLAPGEGQHHQAVAEPGRTRPGKQHGTKQQQCDQPHRPRAPTLARRPQHERRQHRQRRSELEVVGTEDAGDALGLSVAAQAPAGERLHPGVQRPQRDHRRHRQIHHSHACHPAQRKAGIQAQRREAQQPGHRAPALAGRHRIDRGDQRRADVASQDQQQAPRALVLLQRVWKAQEQHHRAEQAQRGAQLGAATERQQRHHQPVRQQGRTQGSAKGGGKGGHARASAKVTGIVGEPLARGWPGRAGSISRPAAPPARRTAPA